MAVGIAREHYTIGGFYSVGMALLPLPSGYELLRGTKGGLLLQSVAPSASGEGVRLWTPLSAKVASIRSGLAA